MAQEFRIAHAAELDHVYALRARAFERGTPGDWAQDAANDPWRDAGVDLVAVDNGRVVATLRLLDRRMAGLDGEPVRLAGIGAVASDPVARRRGNVRQLLALAHKRSRAAGYDLSMLFTGSPWVYSGSGGYATLPLWALNLDTALYPPSLQRWRTAPFDPSAHLAGVRAVYEQFGHGRPGYPLRDDAYWSHPRVSTMATWAYVALDNDDRVVGYIHVRLAPDDRALLVECPYVVDDSVGALVAAVKNAVTLPQGRIGGRLPRDHVLGTSGEWSVREDAMAHAYTATGAALLEAMRGAASTRVVYWLADGF